MHTCPNCKSLCKPKSDKHSGYCSEECRAEFDANEASRNQRNFIEKATGPGVGILSAPKVLQPYETFNPKNNTMSDQNGLYKQLYEDQKKNSEALQKHWEEKYNNALEKYHEVKGLYDELKIESSSKDRKHEVELQKLRDENDLELRKKAFELQEGTKEGLSGLTAEKVKTFAEGLSPLIDSVMGGYAKVKHGPGSGGGNDEPQMESPLAGIADVNDQIEIQNIITMLKDTENMPNPSEVIKVCKKVTMINGKSPEKAKAIADLVNKTFEELKKAAA